MVEGEGEPDTLVEVTLRERVRGGDRVGERAETGQQRRVVAFRSSIGRRIGEGLKRADLGLRGSESEEDLRGRIRALRLHAARRGQCRNCGRFGLDFGEAGRSERRSRDEPRPHQSADPGFPAQGSHHRRCPRDKHSSYRTQFSHRQDRRDTSRSGSRQSSRCRKTPKGAHRSSTTKKSPKASCPWAFQSPYRRLKRNGIRAPSKTTAGRVDQRHDVRAEEGTGSLLLGQGADVPPARDTHHDVPSGFRAVTGAV